jgi:hypothetical protein
MAGIRSYSRAVLASAVVCTALAASYAHAVENPDSLYLARHPTLFFRYGDLPALRARVQPAGPPKDAYVFIRDTYEDRYLFVPFDTLIANDFAQEPIVNIGLAGYLQNTIDNTALALGRDLTLYIARNWNFDTDAYYTSLRLRALAIGYDLYFMTASSAERAEVRAEVIDYLEYMTTNLNYDIWRHRPYTSNKTAMVAAALGLAAISFAGEISPALTDAALDYADVLYNAWRTTHISADGCYREGTLYALWSLRNLIYFFQARTRYDGTVYTTDASLRAMEFWLAYELDPRGGARLNNLNDQTDFYHPLARHTTYFDWALSGWDSGLARYMWDRSCGPLGIDMKDENDKASTVLWYKSIASINPGTILPKGLVWQSRGLYYYRSGWPTGASSDDFVLSFYSGVFRGGHAQEDQNQFTLAAFGQKIVVDHGAGMTAKNSEAHNIVRVNQAGQHNAGSSIGTDGTLTNWIVTGFADYVCGDATLAYTTYSPYNAAGTPYPWSDWSWGYDGGNPVQHALRRLVVVHGGTLPTYVLVQDDIQKDDAVNRYDWCVHFPDAATVDTANPNAPIGVAVGSARMDVHALFPLRNALAGVSVTPFDNQSEDPDSKLLKLTSFAVNPKFAVLMIPRRDTDPAPAVYSSSFPYGSVSVVVGPGTTRDVILARSNYTGPITPTPVGAGPDAPGCGPLSIDAQLAVVRLVNGLVTRYLAVDAAFVACSSGDIFTIGDGTATVVFDGSRVYIDRADADFRILADGVTEVVCRGQKIPTILVGRYLIPDPATDVAAPAVPALLLRAYPNPFHPSVRVSFVLPSRAHVQADVYDAAGRFVVTLATEAFSSGEHALEWNGRDQAGRALPSGVYFLRVSALASVETVKLVLLR